MTKKNNGSVKVLQTAYIGNILWIAESCRLTSWTFDGYFDELRRSDSIGLMYTESVNCSSEKIQGFIISRLIMSEMLVQFQTPQSLLSTDRDTKPECEPAGFAECEILNFGVLPTAQKQGIGQNLLDATLSACRLQNVRYIWAEVRETNNRAVKFYQKNDFIVSYTRKNYYLHPVENALVMKAEIFY